MTGCRNEDANLNSVAVQYVDTINPRSLKVAMPDTANQDIYDFMKIVIADQKIQVDYELVEMPFVGFQDENDIDFMYSFVMDTITANEKNTNNNRIIVSSGFNRPQCMTKKDVQYMLTQRKRLSDFKWDRTRLGLNSANENYSYRFSIPLFSVDHEKVLIATEMLCPGLCGNGSALLYIKKNGKWESQTVNGWYH